MNSFTAYADAWMSGQEGSKLWLCRELEHIVYTKQQVVWLLCGWYGRAAEMLLIRERVPIAHIRSFDADPASGAIADIVNDLWLKDWRFKAFTADVNELDWTGVPYNSTRPDLVINTATEHLTNDAWWREVPEDTLVALQATDLEHATQTHRFTSLDDFDRYFAMKSVSFAGSLRFDYGDHGFTRWMKIGRK